MIVLFVEINLATGTIVHDKNRHPPSNSSLIFKSTVTIFSVPAGFSNPTTTGLIENVPRTLCSMVKACQNGGSCVDAGDGQSYNCSCPSGFVGPHCQSDHRPCQDDTCWNDGNHVLCS